MIIKTYAADSMIYRTIGLIQEAIDKLDSSADDYYIKMGNAMEKYAIEASMTKVFGSEVSGQVIDHALQILGGYGFIEEYRIAGAYRDDRINRIWEGTNEINRMIISGYMIKKNPHGRNSIQGRNCQNKFNFRQRYPRLGFALY